MISDQVTNTCAKSLIYIEPFSSKTTLDLNFKNDSSFENIFQSHIENFKRFENIIRLNINSAIIRNLDISVFKIINRLEVISISNAYVTNFSSDWFLYLF